MTSQMTHREHTYTSRLIWTGNTGDGTGSYAGYDRGYRVSIAGKPDLLGSADPMFRGTADVHNPEELFLASISSCHMLSYLALCARRGIRVVAYHDDAEGTLLLDASGEGRFTTVTLRPHVTVDGDADTALAIALHTTAHELCFIANSCRVPIDNEPTVVVAGAVA